MVVHAVHACPVPLFETDFWEKGGGSLPRSLWEQLTGGRRRLLTLYMDWLLQGASPLVALWIAARNAVSKNTISRSATQFARALPVRLCR